MNFVLNYNLKFHVAMILQISGVNFTQRRVVLFWKSIMLIHYCHIFA